VASERFRDAVDADCPRTAAAEALGNSRITLHRGLRRHEVASPDTVLHRRGADNSEQEDP